MTWQAISVRPYIKACFEPEVARAENETEVVLDFMESKVWDSSGLEAGPDRAMRREQ
jgi:hypothetical protein